MSDQITVTAQNIKDFLCVETTQYDSQIESLVSWWSPAIEERLDPTALGNTNLLSTLTIGKIMVIAGYVKSVLPPTAVGLASGKLDFQQGGMKVSYQNTEKTQIDLIAEGNKLLLPYYSDDFKNTSDILCNNLDSELEFVIERVDSGGNVITAGTMQEW